MKITVDITALSQGIWDARDAKKIPSIFADRVYNTIQTISYTGKYGREVCDYDKLLVVLSIIEPPDHWIVLVRLWEHLGKSLASAISVAAN